ncbi:hypothetical protein [Actinokineospora xionganensis]|uniref:Uncharacterized protein n=1 Tax=Actinokineospora xionganensis TaxID=2684470 RepID=A0ABR7LEU6_9PSEU|nr:hypothetical protein [Actinokineospora xionganensis]MBC6451194.1 hypothetical protein [Actinokineospora xionganensis]
MASRLRHCLLLLLALFATVLVSVAAPIAGAAPVAPEPAEAGATVGGPHVDVMAPSRSAWRVAKEVAYAQPAAVPPAPAVAPWPRPVASVPLDDFLSSAPRWAHRGAIGDRAPPTRRVDL